ncbi:fimbrial assembly chaperone domain protein [Burkholderia pseudomallei NAU35A-3]|nr:fimbrial assembly chaperone domain protein [Burkholderia pseudomallei NAU35A-3]KGS28804.1 fimbrial assembly chaperone domain protein [Burkholderia pseudomallei MSHR5569]
MPLMLSLASLGRSGGLPSAHPMRSRVRGRMRGGTARSTWPARGAMRPTTAYAIAPGAGPFACRYRAPRLDGPAHCEPTSRHCLACLRPEITIVRDAASCRFLHALSSSSARVAPAARTFLRTLIQSRTRDLYSRIPTSEAGRAARFHDSSRWRAGRGASASRMHRAVRIRAHSKAHARTPRERSASVPRVRAAEWARWRDNRRAVDRGARHAPLLHASRGRRFQAPPCAAVCRPPCASARRLGAMRAAWALARAISRSRMKRFRAGAALRVCGAGSIFSASEATWRRPSSQ